MEFEQNCKLYGMRRIRIFISDVLRSLSERMQSKDEPATSRNTKMKKVRFLSGHKTHAFLSENISMLIKYMGSCHCGVVTFEVVAPRKLPVFDCNCSICSKKQGKQFLVPSARFQLLTGHNELTTYTFGTHQAKHMFCSKCGVESFFIPRANPNVIAVMPHCLDSPLPLKIQTELFDGRNWEQAIKKSNIPDVSKH